VFSLKNLPKFVKAQIDPFNHAADGCKIPDSNTYPSSPLKIEDQFLAESTDANGLLCRAYIPMLKNTRILHTAAGASSWKWSAAYGGGNDSGRLASVAANFSLVRPVAHGIKISCPSAPTTITGNLHVAVMATSDFGKTTWNFPRNVTELSNSMFYRKYPLAMFTQQSLTVVNKFLDCTSTRYIDPSADGIDNSGDVSLHTNGWAAIIVSVDSAPANSPVLTVEHVIHMEAIPLITGVDTASPAAPFDVRQQQVVSRMAAVNPAAFTDQEEQSYLSQIYSQLSQGMSDYGRDAFQHFVLPAARRVGYAAAGAAASYVSQYGLPGVTQFRHESPFITM